MKSFQIEQYDGKLHLMSDGWSMKGDADMCRRELNKWLDECNED